MSKLTSIDYSWSVYYKHSWKTPGFMGLHEARHNWQTVGGITRAGRQVNNYDQLGDRTLALFLWPMHYYLGYHFCTYNQDSRVTNDCQNAPAPDMDDYELGWTWFYMAYSSRRQKAYAVVQSGLSKTLFEINWPGRQHNKKPDALRFHIGLNGDWSANGRYFDIRLDYGPGSYFGNIEDVLAYKD
jgi:hypothetical protein